MTQTSVPVQGAAWESRASAFSSCGRCQQCVNGLAIESSSCSSETFRRITQAPKQPLNPKQQENSAGIQKMIAGHRWTSAVSQQKAKELFTYLDNLEFYGELSGRCELVMGHPGAMDRRMRGETSVTRRCDTQRRILEVKITMNPDESELGFTGSRLLQFAGTLLHEMCHATILLYYAECRSLSCLESITYLGMEGHGTIFEALFRSMADLFVRSTGWTISLEAHLYNSVFQDRRKRAEAAYTWIEISYHLPESARNHAGLTQLLNLTQHESDRLVQLIIDGRDVLEIILILRYGIWDGYWRLPPWNTARLIEAEKDTYSVLVKGISEGSITVDAIAHFIRLLPPPLHLPPPPFHPPLALPLPPLSLNPILSRKRFLTRASIPTARPGTKRRKTKT